MSEDIAVCISRVDIYQYAFLGEIEMNDLETRAVCSEVYDIAKSGSWERKQFPGSFSSAWLAGIHKGSVNTTRT